MVGGLFDKVWGHRDDLPDFEADLKFLVTWCEWSFCIVPYNTTFVLVFWISDPDV